MWSVGDLLIAGRIPKARWAGSPPGKGASGQKVGSRNTSVNSWVYAIVWVGLRILITEKATSLVY